MADLFIPINKTTKKEYPPVSAEQRDEMERHPQTAGKYQFRKAEETPKAAKKKETASKPEADNK